MDQDHGGDLDRAIAAYGGAPSDWIDLSTGINRTPWPLPALLADVWTALPTRAGIAALADAARTAYGAAGAILALAGVQAAIQLTPRLLPPGRARVLGPTYSEHALSLRAQGWMVDEVTTTEALSGADLAVVVNPNNPDGRRTAPDELLRLRDEVGLLVVDESFADPEPGLSLAGAVAPGLIVLRSFGKFYGLAGLRLGFALGAETDVERLAALAGPWQVSGPAVAIGTAALADRAWAAATRARLVDDVARLDALAAAGGWSLAGGAALFRLYATPDATTAQAGLARARIWSRVFPWSRTLLRLGLPGGSQEWDRLAAVLGGCT